MNEDGAAPDLRALLRMVGGDAAAADADGGRSKLLSQVVRAAVDVVPGMMGCSLTEMDGAQLITAVSSADFCRDLDELQYREGTGPCVRAARDRQRQSVPDLDDEPAREFARGAKDRGVRSVLSVPVRSPHHPTGLNLYNERLDGFADRLYVERAELVSRAVSAILVGRRLGETAEPGLPSGTRDLVIRARAVVMDRHGWTAAQALDWLMRTAASQRRSLFELAVDVVDGGRSERSE